MDSLVCFLSFKTWWEMKVTLLKEADIVPMILKNLRYPVHQ